MSSRFDHSETERAGLLEDSTDPPEKRDSEVPAGAEVEALCAVFNENGTRAREIVRSMPRRDRAIFTFWLLELTNIIDEIQLGDRL
jgi:hypothetical protein